MQTLTTKQLRENLSAVIDQLKNGQAVQLSYRRKVIGILQPANVQPQALRRGSPEAIRSGLASLQANPGSRSSVDRRSIKEQIAEYRERKYKA